MIAFVATAALAGEPGLQGPGPFLALSPVEFSAGRVIVDGVRSPTSSVGAGLSAGFSVLGMVHSGDEGVFVEDYFGVGAAVGRQGGPGAEARAASGGHMWGFLRVEAGLGLATHDSEFDGWVRTGLWTGNNTVNSSSLIGGGEWGYRLAAGFRAESLFVEVSPIALGAAHRAHGARVFVMPGDTSLMFGVDVEHDVFRDLNTRFRTTRIALCFGIL